MDKSVQSFKTGIADGYRDLIAVRGSMSIKQHHDWALHLLSATRKAHPRSRVALIKIFNERFPDRPIEVATKAKQSQAA
jgi:hypothetical protein